MSQNVVSGQLPQPPQSMQGFWAHGRFYGGWRPRKYLFPIDAEELNRLDIFHKFFLVARKDAVCSHSLNLGRTARVLDLGTGTGIWAINVAEESEHVPEIMAVDINRIQPALIPRGMMTMQFDIEEPSWDSLMWNCDLIHLRMLFGSIQTDLWPDTYRKIFEHLAPGTGTVEHVEIDWVPRWEHSGEFPENSAFKEWSDAFLKALDLFNRSARVSTHHTRHMIEQAGFCDFQEQTIRCYVNPWSANSWEQETARWFNLGLKHCLEAMSLMPMIERLRMTAEQVNDLCARVKEENTKLRYHGYCTIHIWTARKPAHPAPRGPPKPDVSRLEGKVPCFDYLDGVESTRRSATKANSKDIYLDQGLVDFSRLWKRRRAASSSSDARVTWWKVGSSPRRFAGFGETGLIPSL
ncbi:hypothetical protein CDD83_2777 [Cordyceps sp. RAO-2017]|nr:hypothetical protein CDD83_2777 [Cordyceps sp. RAO-2017]